MGYHRRNSCQCLCSNDGYFPIETDNSEPFGRDTMPWTCIKTITYLKETNQQLWEEERLKKELKKFSKSIKYKIVLYTPADPAWVNYLLLD